MLYNLEAARTQQQYDQMVDLEARGVCFFCPEHFDAEHKYPIAKRWQSWLLSRNDYPYAETEVHYLLFPRQHVASLGELSIEAQREYGLVLADIESEYSLTHYAVGMRAGDFRYNGSSVEHLHAHIIVAKKEPTQKVRFAMSRSPIKQGPP
jgi:diadenosine tetraphosphate (Ap4A) HIT family hydrolase